MLKIIFNIAFPSVIEEKELEGVVPGVSGQNFYGRSLKSIREIIFILNEICFQETNVCGPWTCCNCLGIKVGFDDQTDRARNRK